jgi:hypothetical protein
MRILTALPRPAALLGATAALTLLVSGCGAVVAEAAREILLDVAKEVIVQTGAEYLTKIFSPDDSDGKPTVTVSYTNTTGYAVGTSYAVAGATHVTSKSVTVKNATGTIKIADDDNGISVTVADGSSGTIDIQLNSETRAGTVGADAQAATINGILSWSGRTRSALYAALNDLDECRNPADATTKLRTVAAGRTQQIGSLHHLEVSALPNGESLRDTLVQALNASFQADQAFIRWGITEQSTCRHDSNYRQGMAYSHTATATKADFLSGWNPLAPRYGLPTYQEPDI